MFSNSSYSQIPNLTDYIQHGITIMCLKTKSDLFSYSSYSQIPILTDYIQHSITIIVSKNLCLICFLSWPSTVCIPGFKVHGQLRSRSGTKESLLSNNYLLISTFTMQTHWLVVKDHHTFYHLNIKNKQKALTYSPMDLFCCCGFVFFFHFFINI